MATPASLLALVDAAIEARLTNGTVEEYTIRGRRLRRASLAELQDMRKQLNKEASAVASGGLPVGYGIVSGPKA